MPIVFDPSSKRIILDSVSVTATEIYSRWVDWAATSDNIKYGMVIRQVGSDDLGGGLSIPPYYFLQNGWRVRPMEANHNLTITGNLFVEGGGVPVVSTLGTYQVNVNYTVPVQAQGISTTGSTGVTLSEIEASPVLAKEATVLSRASQTSVDNLSISAGGLTPNQATMLLEMYELLGLDPTKPLVVTETSRTVGSINQTILTDPTQTILTRN